MQLLNRHLPNHRHPLVGHSDDLLLVILQRPFMELCDISIGMIKELYDDSAHIFLAIKDVLEVEEFHQQVTVVLVLKRRQLFDALAGSLFLMRNIAFDAFVANDGLRCNL